MKQKQKQAQEVLKDPEEKKPVVVEEAPAEGGGSPEEKVDPNVLFTMGIHQMKLPARGSSVADAREILAPLMNIDPEAVVVINGEIVDTDKEADTIIGRDVDMVAFVKQASLKGNTVTMTSEGTVIEPKHGNRMEMPNEVLVQAIVKHSQHGMHPEPMSSAVRWWVTKGKRAVAVCEFEPQLRSLLWADTEKDWRNQNYTQRTLATPFTVIKVVLDGRMLVGLDEVFYRNERLSSINDTLHQCNLLNVSPHSYNQQAWMCTQYTNRAIKHEAERLGRSLTQVEIVNVVVRDFWESGFNFSSDAHEGQSGFSRYAKRKGCDSRLKDSESWEQASKEDWRFILGIDWEPTGETVRECLERTIEGAGKDCTDVKQLIQAVKGGRK